jgi:hypothetical protein
MFGIPFDGSFARGMLLLVPANSSSVVLFHFASYPNVHFV